MDVKETELRGGGVCFPDLPGESSFPAFSLYWCLTLLSISFKPPFAVLVCFYWLRWETSDKGLFPLWSVCVCVHVLRCLWHCRHFGRLCLITMDTEGNKSCLSWSQVLHNSCRKCQQSKQSGQQDLLHCCSAVTQLSSTRYACCGKPFIFTIMCDLAADGWYRANCGSKTRKEGNVYGKTWIVGSPP